MTDDARLQAIRQQERCPHCYQWYASEAKLAAAEARAASAEQERDQLMEDVAEGDCRVIQGVVVHWFIQGGKAQFGPLDYRGRDPQNEDEVISAILSCVRQQLASAEAEVRRRLELEQGKNEKEKALGLPGTTGREDQ